MARARVVLIAVALAAGAAVVPTTPPAHAAGTCTGTGVLNTPALSYPPPLGTPNSGLFSGFLSCAEGGTASLSGGISGHCGAAMGRIVVDGVGPQDFTIVGTTMSIGPGGATGQLTILPAVGQSCVLPSTTTQFSLSGSVVS